jgi:glycine/sarcosine N-methyltransferase
MPSIGTIAILRQLECIMADCRQFYDELAPHYDQIFENWEASIVRQATVLGGIIQRECGDKRPVRVLDCACGIGTQSLGLAMKGFEVEGCDTSPGAVERARSEALKRGLNVPFSVANMLQLTAIARSSFDAVICIDNSLPHLESDEQLLQAAQQARAKLRTGGSFVGSIRDYDRMVVERPATQGPSFYSEGDGRRRIVFQIWDWLDERRYRFHLYITRSTQSEWHTFHFTSTYRAILRNELGDILTEAGFRKVRWLLPFETTFYQPLFIAQQ